MNTKEITSWPRLAFNEVIVDKTGGNPKVKKSDYGVVGAIPIIDQGSKYIAGYTNDESLKCNVELPAILFGDHTKIFKYVTTPFALGADGVKVLAPKFKMNKRYLFHCLSQVNLPTDAGYSRHFKFLKEASIQVPPEKEQKKIADILDKADALRRKRAEALRLADDFLKSTFLDMFGDPVTNPMGWDIISAGDDLDFLTSGSRGWAKYYDAEGDIFIRIQNLRGGFLDLSDVAFVKAPDSAESKRTLVQPGDVLLSITADLGRTAVVPEGIGKAHINQHLAILRFSTLNPVFVSHFLGTSGGQHQFETLNKSAVKAGLNFIDIRSIQLFNPPNDLQEKFVRVVDKVEDISSKLKLSLIETECAFGSIQQKIFGS